MNFYGRYFGLFGGGGSSTTGGTPYQEIPAGLIDSANTIYTVTVAPNPITAFELFKDGLILVQGVDYTIVGNTITMTSAPLFGETLYAVYSVTGGAVTGVTTLNGAVGSVNILPGSGITVTTVGQNITVAAIPGGGVLTVVGTSAAPILITAGGGIPFTSVTTLTKIYIAGNGGPVTITANPQIAAGTIDGQRVQLQGCSAANTVTIQQPAQPFNGIWENGDWVAAKNNTWEASWDAASTLWIESSRQ